jgi:hypothetical protein
VTFVKFSNINKSLNKAPIFYLIKVISENIQKIIKLLSVIEWNCNIIEYIYANNDVHPHLHKENFGI